MAPVAVYSRWGRRAAAGYLLVLSATLGFVTYRLLFQRSEFIFPGRLLLSLGMPWTRAAGTAWPILLVSYAINTAMLYFIGSRLEQRAQSGDS
jgi:hypothetical protein